MQAPRESMTSRQRILAALRREDVDYVACCAVFNPLHLTQLTGHAWNFPWPQDATPEERLSYQVQQLGLDQVVNVYVSLCRPQSDVESRVWLEEDVLHKAYRTPAGELHAAVRYNDAWPHGRDIPFYSDFNVGHFVEPWVTNEADLDCLKVVISLCETVDVLQQVREEVARARKLADGFHLATLAHVGSGLTGAMQLFGASELCVMTLDNPGLVDAYLEHEHQINLRTLDVLAHCDVDIIRRNGFYETADFYGPEALETFVGARVRREADAARAGGMLTSYTVNTGVMPLLDYLAGLTVDSLFGIDMAFEGVDLATLKRKLTERKCLWIGPSSVYHLWKGPEATRQAVRAVFEVLGRKGVILVPCVSAHSIMPWESTLAMIDEWKKLRSP